MAGTVFLLQEQAKAATVLLLLLTIFLQHGAAGLTRARSDWEDMDEDHFELDEADDFNLDGADDYDLDEAVDFDLDEDLLDGMDDAEAYEESWGVQRSLVKVEHTVAVMPTLTNMQSKIYVPVSKNLGQITGTTTFPPDANGEDNPLRHKMIGKDMQFEVGLGLEEKTNWIASINTHGGDATMFREIRIPAHPSGEHPRGKHLPFIENSITSTKLNNPPGPTDPVWFFTDLLSGCSIFIDEVEGALIVYHANLKSDAPFQRTHDYTKKTITSAPQTTMAQIMKDVKAKNFVPPMRLLHTLAKHDWEKKLKPKVITKGHELNKDTYNAKAGGAAADRGTTVIGRWIGAKQGGHWEFYYQTYEVSGTTKILDTQKFYETH